MKKFRKQDSEKYFEEKKPVRLVDTQEYMEMIRALLEDGQEVSMIVTGNSWRSVFETWTGQNLHEKNRPETKKRRYRILSP